MPAEIGQMFYYGEVPWHGEGYKAKEPLTVEEAIRHGDLDWEVEMIGLQTAEENPSPVFTRKAVVRMDKKPGDDGRVIGVAHNDFVPLQNREGAKIFDAVFGKGGKVYHTGGYLGKGEKIWLLAELPGQIKVLDNDIVRPYVLFSNSHDGSIAIDMRLTAVRVVCQNTLSIALADKTAQSVFKQAHDGNYGELKKEVEKVFEKTLKAVAEMEASFRALYDTPLPEQVMDDFLLQLYPEPTRPTGVGISSSRYKAHETRVRNVQRARETIRDLRLHGKGADMARVKMSVWGGLNAVLEYVDHYQDEKSFLVQGLFGSKAAIKKKAYDMAMEYVGVNRVERR